MGSSPNPAWSSGKGCWCDSLETSHPHLSVEFRDDSKRVEMVLSIPDSERADEERVVHLPIPDSWLTQFAISCSIVHRRVLAPHAGADLAAVEARLTAFATHDHDPAVSFTWRFTRAPLEARLADLTPIPPAATALPEAA